MAGPLWLLQLWLNMIYSPSYFSPPSVPGSDTPYCPTFVPINKCVKKEDSIQAFHFYFNWFWNLKAFQPNFTFMSLRRNGPEWFTRKVLCSSDPDQQVETFKLWRNYLTCQVLYQPNLVARQFGLSQNYWRETPTSESYSCFFWVRDLPFDYFMFRILVAGIFQKRSKILRRMFHRPS